MVFRFGYAGALLLAAAPALSGGTSTMKPDRVSITQCGPETAQADAARLLAAAIRVRVDQLPVERRSAEDYEAAIVYEISQHNACPGVARLALSSLSGGSGPLALAVSMISSTQLPVGTAGIVAASYTGGSGNSFFSAPIVGIGGGSANYSR
jgi:hypothetical protein